MVDDAAVARTSMLALLRIYDLWTEPIDRVGEAVRLQNHPDIARVKWHLENEFIAHLEAGSRMLPGMDILFISGRFFAWPFRLYFSHECNR